MIRCNGDCDYYCLCWDTPAMQYLSDVDFLRIANQRCPALQTSSAKEPECCVLIPNVKGVKSKYELTLTTADVEPCKLNEAMVKIAKSKMFNLVYWEYAVELTKEGRPHIHAILYSGKRFLDATKIKSFWKERFELKKVMSEANYLLYISKEKNNPIVIDYCKKHKIEQYVKCQANQQQPKSELEVENLA